MNLLFIFFLICPIYFSQTEFERGLDSFEDEFENTPIEVEEYETDQENEFYYEDPLLELGGSEKINYAQDYIVDESMSVDNIDERD